MARYFFFETEFVNLKETQVGLNDINLRANGVQVRNEIEGFGGRGGSCQLLALEIRFHISKNLCKRGMRKGHVRI